LDAVEDREIELRLGWRYGDRDIVCGLLALASSHERLDYQ
jgi:hypothetical protein